MSKHTKGECRVIDTIILGQFSPPKYDFLIGTDNLAIARTIQVHNEDETLANAELIAEAFNVANETGKTPRELAEENRELLDALKMVNEILSNGISILPGLAIHNEIIAVIQKASK